MQTMINHGGKVKVKGQKAKFVRHISYEVQSSKFKVSSGEERDFVPVNSGLASAH